MIFSIIFLMNRRLDISLWLVTALLSRLGFFSDGFLTAVLNTSAKVLS